MTTERQETAGLSDTYNPFTSPQIDDPHPVWARAREQEPVFYSTVLAAWVVTRYDDVAWVLRDHATFSSVGGSKPLTTPTPEVAEILARVPDAQQMDVLTSDPPRHSRLRQYMQDAFTPKRIGGLEPDLRTLAEELVDRVAADGTCDFYQAFAHPFPLSAIGRLIGLRDVDDLPLTHWVTCNIQLKWGNLDPEAHLTAARGRVDFYDFGLRLIAERRAAPGDDLLSALIVDSDASDDPLTEPELVGQIMTLLTAGHETTANWLTLALYRLLQEPGRWEAFCSDRSLLAAVVEETLRFDGPAQGLWRTATRDVAISGVLVPAGARLSAVVGSADRDHRTFRDPDEFDLARPNAKQHLQFGRGIHTCVGAGLARLEGRVAFDVLADRLPGLALVDGGAMTFAPNAIQRVPRRLLVRWDP
jgi:cytochrome P450